ncbi:MAG: ATP-binding protein, partial [Flavobacterium sp.]
MNNLLTNAIKYTSSGIITIRLKILPYHLNSLVEFCIIDQGIGIPPGELEIIFRPFVQSTLTISQKRGTGLGLSICKELIEKNYTVRA